MVTKSERISNHLYKLLEKTKTPMYFDSHENRDGMKEGEGAKAVVLIRDIGARG